MSSVLWRREDGLGLEHCAFAATGEGWRLTGTTLLVADDAPVEIRYSVQTDREWRTRTVGAHVQTPEGDRRMTLSCDGAGSWFAGDLPLLDLYGAIDVDLGWTPATNTLPIRRLGLEVGETAEIVAAWVGFPEQRVERLTQVYERLDATTYRYSAGDLATDLRVDEMGRVVVYPGGWEAIALSSAR